VLQAARYRELHPNVKHVPARAAEKVKLVTVLELIRSYPFPFV
jgi:hypothetical protein